MTRKFFPGSLFRRLWFHGYFKLQKMIHCKLCIQLKSNILYILLPWPQHGLKTLCDESLCYYSIKKGLLFPNDIINTYFPGICHRCFYITNSVRVVQTILSVKRVRIQSVCLVTSRPQWPQIMVPASLNTPSVHSMWAIGIEVHWWLSYIHTRILIAVCQIIFLEECTPSFPMLFIGIIKSITSTE